MLRNFDEKLNGFLFVAILSILLLAMSSYGYESFYARFEVSYMIFQKFSLYSTLYISFIFSGIFVACHLKNFIIKS